MAIYTGWRVVSGQTTSGGGVQDTLGVPDDATDFSTRVLSVEVDMACALGRFGSSSARIVLDNSDGAFTPFGGGTYEDWDWLANPVWIQAKTGTNPASLTAIPPLFGGVVSGVQYRDDGFSATVTIDCDDPYTLVARGLLIKDWDNFLLPKQMDAVFEDFYFNDYVQDPPSFGADTTPFLVGSAAGFDYFQDLEFAADTGVNYGDMATDMMVSEHGVGFPWILYVNPRGALNEMRYDGYAIARNWLWGDSASLTLGLGIDEYSFVEGTPTGTELPFRAPTVGFNIDSLTNSAACQVAGTGAVLQEAENSASVAAYGPRSAELTSLLFGYDADALELANHLVTRYSTVDFGITGLTITGKMVEGKCADAALDMVSHLLQAPNFGLVDTVDDAGVTVFRGYDTPLRGPLFIPMFVEFTGAGGVNLSSRLTFFRASYRITPDDWELVLSDGRPAVSSFGFVIGNTNYGVLGTNRLA